jgi:hypothetical protein
MMAVLLGRLERWRRWDVERSDLFLLASTGGVAGLVVSSNAAVKPASCGIDFDVTYVAY